MAAVTDVKLPTLLEGGQSGGYHLSRALNAWKSSDKKTEKVETPKLAAAATLTRTAECVNPKAEKREKGEANTEEVVEGCISTEDDRSEPSGEAEESVSAHSETAALKESSEAIALDDESRINAIEAEATSDPGMSSVDETKAEENTTEEIGEADASDEEDDECGVEDLENIIEAITTQEEEAAVGGHHARVVDAESEEAFWKAAQKALRERARKEKVFAFLRKHGFKGVNERKGWFFNYTYPLHVAVELNNVDVVRALIKCKARKKLRDSSGRTPKQTALYLNRFGSHDEMLSVLHRPKRQAPASRQPLAEDVAIDSSILNDAKSDMATAPVSAYCSSQVTTAQEADPAQSEVTSVSATVYGARAETLPDGI